MLLVWIKEHFLVIDYQKTCQIWSEIETVRFPTIFNLRLGRQKEFKLAFWRIFDINDKAIKHLQQYHTYAYTNIQNQSLFTWPSRLNYASSRFKSHISTSKSCNLISWSEDFFFQFALDDSFLKFNFRLLKLLILYNGSYAHWQDFILGKTWVCRIVTSLSIINDSN